MAAERRARAPPEPPPAGRNGLGGGAVLGLTSAYVSGYLGSSLVTMAALLILVTVLLVKPGGLFSSSVARKV